MMMVGRHRSVYSLLAGYLCAWESFYLVQLFLAGSCPRVPRSQCACNCFEVNPLVHWIPGALPGYFQVACPVLILNACQIRVALSFWRTGTLVPHFWFCLHSDITSLVNIGVYRCPSIFLSSALP
ncbi:hypothetical protein B0H17DRAFT_1078437 [Mycena rosella]|uniref:Uncharacterized protein n=1 Tax=Mycena rosella TaxID=1033263 RepID=A0AAD7D4Q8_MYCRO|nr:hypothetical protein B0H17DRAFT_1078437 [Mycena rosella]